MENSVFLDNLTDIFLDIIEHSSELEWFWLQAESWQEASVAATEFLCSSLHTEVPSIDDDSFFCALWFYSTKVVLVLAACFLPYLAVFIDT